MLVDVNPEILIWARSESGYLKPKDVAERLTINLSELERWERDGKEVAYDNLEKIAKLYKRQTAIFFLPSVPQKANKPRDYRNLVLSSAGFSPETLLAIRRTERYLRIARELHTTQYWNGQYNWIKNFNGKYSFVKREAKLLRVLLESTIEDQIKQKDPDEAFRYWRRKIEEKLGIFVFQFAMPDEELDGFSYLFGEFPYAIVINNSKHSVRKIFTLFHELAHILKRKPGACDTSFSEKTDHFKIELECNDFSGNFLVPDESIESVSSVDDIFKIARTLNVSGEAYLWRLFKESNLEESVFFTFLKQVRKRSQEFPRKKKKGNPSIIIQSKSSRGNKFFNLVTNAAQSGQIGFSTASDLLGLKIGSIRL